ncbi:MAG TPA: fimbria/pilus periplasmic chaperone [Allosphingosinicella sp.]|uniref:fimbrial biogenesis chaperone n=1 Tax=Allosphingosinicella sp. TaxID=2823234 RepID=UPI002EDA451A
MLISEPALASSIEVNPIKVQIAAIGKTGAVTVTNRGHKPVTLKAKGQSWRQVNGSDVFADVPDLIISPPVATVMPGQSQLMRVGLRSKAQNDSFYRILIEEVPQIDPEDGVRVSLRFNLPLFVAQKEAKSLSKVSWSVKEDAANERVILEARNNDTQYVDVDAADVSAQAGVQLKEKYHFGVILPGSSKRWLLERASIAGPVQFASIKERAPGADAPR